MAAGQPVLAWGRDREGRPLVATGAGLWGYGELLAWEEIDHVRWAEDILLVVAVDGDARPVPLGEPRDLPAVVRAKVEASVLHSRRVGLLPDGRGVTVIARRLADGAIDWRLRFDAGLSPDDPDLRAQADDALERVRAELGV